MLGETFGACAPACEAGAVMRHGFAQPASHDVVSMEAFWVSAALVALAEIGDKTQILAIVLAARFRRPAPIILGIFVATILNHALAAWAGALAASWLTPRVLAYVLAASFLAMAVWALIPDKHEDAPAARGARGVFIATAIAFFLVEMGDKTQLATAALAANWGNVWIVAAGTTLGMLAANIPAVLLGEAALRRAPLRLVRFAAAAVFAIMGLIALFSALGLGGSEIFHTKAPGFP